MKSISNFTIVFALIFATNGTFALINGFNENTDERKGDIYEFIISFFITIGFISIIFLAFFGVYYSEVVLKLFTPKSEISWLVDNLTQIISYISFPIFYFILLALFYWLGTVRLTRFRHAIPGALFTTIIFFVTTYLFAFYVSKIARYNVLYGSIGSIILLMVWVNLNVILMLFGNELNLAVRKLRMEKLMADAMKHEIEEFHPGVTDVPETSLEHTIILDSEEKP
jgi:membrane protein